MNARGLLEIVKSTGKADIMPGYKLFTREYFKKGRIVDLDSTHRIRVAKEGAFQHPFIFVESSEITGGDPDIAECENEEKALVAIEMILLESKAWASRKREGGDD